MPADPACTDEVPRLAIVGALVTETVRGSELDVNVPVTTLIKGVPVVAIRLAGTSALNCVVLIMLVVKDCGPDGPVHWITELAVKSCPLTVSGKVGPPT